MEKETLEEAAEKRIPTSTSIWNLTETRRSDFKAGAKWQAERMYSEEEVLEHLNHLIMMSSSELDKFTDDEEMVTVKWFEQFKNK